MYGGVLASGGLLAFAWLMRDVNQIERRPVFPEKSVTAILLFGIPAYLLAVFLLSSGAGGPSPARQILLVLVIASAIAVNLMLIYFLARLSLHITRALGYTHHAMHASMIVLLTFLAALSFVVLQRRSNLMVERSSPAAPDRDR